MGFYIILILIGALVSILSEGKIIDIRTALNQAELGDTSPTDDERSEDERKIVPPTISMIFGWVFVALGVMGIVSSIITSVFSINIQIHVK